jgi:hypothetical protein
MSQELVKRLRRVGLHLGNAIAGYRDKDFERAGGGLADAAMAASEAADLIEKLTAKANGQAGHPMTRL